MSRRAPCPAALRRAGRSLGAARRGPQSAPDTRRRRTHAGRRGRWGRRRGVGAAGGAAAGAGGGGAGGAGWRCGIGDRRQRYRRGQRQLLDLRAEIENLSGPRLNLGRRRAQRRLLDQLGILEQADQLAGVRRFAPQHQVALGLLAAQAGSHLELRYPGVVGQHARDPVEKLDGARIRVFFGQDEVVLPLRPLELRAHGVGRERLHASFFGLLVQSDRVFALLHQRDEQCRQRDAARSTSGTQTCQRRQLPARDRSSDGIRFSCGGIVDAGPGDDSLHRRAPGFGLPFGAVDDGS